MEKHRNQRRVDRIVDYVVRYRIKDKELDVVVDGVTKLAIPRFDGESEIEYLKKMRRFIGVLDSINEKLSAKGTEVIRYIEEKKNDT